MALASLRKALLPSIIHPPFKSTVFLTIPKFLTTAVTAPSTATTSTTSQQNPEKKLNTKVNFTPLKSDSEPEPDPTQMEKRDLPPPYDPFRNKPITEDPHDPKNLQEVFHKMRSEGLINNAAKMFDEMSKDGLTHEALELFREIKDKGKMPDVVAHTAVIEAYANAGQCKEAHKVYLRMLSCGIAPNAYTYSVLIRGLDEGGDEKLVKKYVLEMLGLGMRPNARVCVAVFEAFAREGKVEEGKELLREMKQKGFVVDEKGVREILPKGKSKRGPVFRTVMDILFAK